MTRLEFCIVSLFVTQAVMGLSIAADAQYIPDDTQGIVGFYGASSMERLPVEPAIRDRVREFADLRFGRR